MSKEEIILEAAKMPGDAVRAFALESGTVFTVNNKKYNGMLMFENNKLYEVIYKGYDEYGPVYEKTGVSYTPDELNELLQGR